MSNKIIINLNETLCAGGEVEEEEKRLHQEFLLFFYIKLNCLFRAMLYSVQRKHLLIRNEIIPFASFSFSFIYVNVTRGFAHTDKSRWENEES